MKLLWYGEPEVMIDGKMEKSGIWKAQIEMSEDEKVETVKKLLKLGYEVSGMIWDEPGESESFSCKTEADIDKYANDYDEIGCYEDKVKVLIRADYTHIFPMVLGKKECVDEILNLLGLNSNELK